MLSDRNIGSASMLSDRNIEYRECFYALGQKYRNIGSASIGILGVLLCSDRNIEYRKCFYALGQEYRKIGSASMLSDRNIGK